MPGPILPSAPLALRVAQTHARPAKMERPEWRGRPAAVMSAGKFLVDVGKLKPGLIDQLAGGKGSDNVYECCLEVSATACSIRTPFPPLLEY